MTGSRVSSPVRLDAGMAAVFTFPLYHGDRRFGALDLYRDTPGALSADSIAIASTLADVVASYLLNAQAREDLQEFSALSRQASLHDALTGLPNRLLLIERLDHAFARSRRTRRASAVYFIDLDRFKAVNDTHGHGIGDELLVGVAERLTVLLRPSDMVARLAGDEYVVLCEDLESPEQAALIGDRITAALRRPFRLSDAEVVVSASIGIAYSTGADKSSEQLLHDADMAMYQAKNQGGARQQLFDPRRQHATERQAALETRSAQCTGQPRAPPGLPGHRHHRGRADLWIRGIAAMAAPDPWGSASQHRHPACGALTSHHPHRELGIDAGMGRLSSAGRPMPAAI